MANFSLHVIMLVSRLSLVGLVSRTCIQAILMWVCWEWLKRTQPERIWDGIPMMLDNNACDMSNNLVLIKVGDGSLDRWINELVVENFHHLWS